MNISHANAYRPAVLAPAGNKESFLAALAAGADAVYCGLKHYSARMEARNFALDELACLTSLAHDKGVGVYVALNALLKTEDLLGAAKLVAQLEKYVKPEALIIQDLALVPLARQAGFSGEIHLSTLTNLSFSRALGTARQVLGVHRVVMPRELHIDEIKTMAHDCPQGLRLEVFVHGALCYGVSGRCYWSSFLGGKSGLRGRCVQPCRRQYIQADKTRPYFSCRDFSLDVLAKVLLDIPEIAAWKIEGRKKGPHYVYYTTQAYRLLRDEGNDPQTKKIAMGLIERALGRPGTHYFFLPQRPYNPIDTDQHTGSGLHIGNVAGDKETMTLKPREALLAGDMLRIGYEDEPWHQILHIRKAMPKKGRLVIKSEKKKKPLSGTPVFLIDRREKELLDLISQLDALAKTQKTDNIQDTSVTLKYPQRFSAKPYSEEYTVYRTPAKGPDQRTRGVWIGEDVVRDLKRLHLNTWMWLPPVIWPEEQEEISGWVTRAVDVGFKNFVLNMPWQTVWFANPTAVNLWGGPFCNISNPMAIEVMKRLGFAGIILSPELSEPDYLDLPKKSCLPLGLVVSGNWPFCVSRVSPPELEEKTLFSSPKHEGAWTVRYGRNVWVFPNWKLDLGSEKDKLLKAGFRCLVHLSEPVPRPVELKHRPGRWNWDLKI